MCDQSHAAPVEVTRGQRPRAKTLRWADHMPTSTASRRILVLWLVAGAATGTLALAPPAAHAQLTTGAVQGVVTDAEDRTPLGGVTVVVTAGGVTQMAFTEEDGTYRITGLAPGKALVTFFFGKATVERKVRIGPGRTTPVYQATQIE